MEKIKLFLALLLRRPQLYFRKELALIKDEFVLALVKALLRTSYYRNFTGPASSSGKYHPKLDKGYGGCARHIKAVVRMLTVFEEAYPDRPWPCIYAAAITHDLEKYGPGSTYTRSNHAMLMRDRILNISAPIDKNALTLIADIVGSHMGRWETGLRELPKDFLETDPAKFLHMADMIVSRKWYGQKLFL